jgi:hypothetical protein
MRATLWIIVLVAVALFALGTALNHFAGLFQ